MCRDIIRCIAKRMNVFICKYESHRIPFYRRKSDFVTSNSHTDWICTPNTERGIGSCSESKGQVDCISIHGSWSVSIATLQCTLLCFANCNGKSRTTMIINLKCYFLMKLAYQIFFEIFKNSLGPSKNGFFVAGFNF